MAEDEFQCEVNIALQNKTITIGSLGLGGWISVPLRGPGIFPVVPPEARVATAPTPQGGCQCKRCNNPNPYAVPNRPDGSYECFECRT
jgi:hypothetical protein